MSTERQLFIIRISLYACDLALFIIAVLLFSSPAHRALIYWAMIPALSVTLLLTKREKLRSQRH